MARELTMDDLLRKQQAMLDLMMQLPTERDTERITAIAQQLERDAKDLEQLAREFERQELAKAGPPPKGSMEVVLTEAQRKRVLEATGYKMQTLLVRDESGVLSQAMPHTDPRRIEQMAIAEAMRLKALQGGDEETRKQLRALIADIEAQGTGATKDLLDELRKDPNFLGGLLRDK
jgi:hypothetical protein